MPLRKDQAAKSSLLCQAIEQRRLLEFQYDGRRRIVAPYCHGISTRGIESLRAMQVGGSSSSGGFGFGKLWSVDKIGEPRILDEAFVADDPNYNPDDSGMKQIHCRV